MAVCRKCDKYFRNQQALDQHTTAKHTYFECSHCDREFKLARSRDQHEADAHGGDDSDSEPERFDCRICDDKSYDNQNSLDIHMGVWHKTPPSFAHKCKFCSEGFGNPIDLGRHEDQYLCQKRHCNKRFCSDEQRDKHRWRDHDDSCVIC
ncbi:hypothetical protein B0H34DRAFT_525975 [Crassisporium funariophilum]|nr:hypothetical protein B0H34DRAFT_525975 [Crassisporium funariophilum]